MTCPYPAHVSLRQQLWRDLPASDLHTHQQKINEHVAYCSSPAMITASIIPPCMGYIQCAGIISFLLPYRWDYVIHSQPCAHASFVHSNYFFSPAVSSSPVGSNIACPVTVCVLMYSSTFSCCATTPCSFWNLARIYTTHISIHKHTHYKV